VETGNKEETKGSACCIGNAVNTHRLNEKTALPKRHIPKETEREGGEEGFAHEATARHPIDDTLAGRSLDSRVVLRPYFTGGNSCQIN